MVPAASPSELALAAEQLAASRVFSVVEPAVEVAPANVTAETLESGRVGPAVEVAAANVTVETLDSGRYFFL